MKPADIVKALHQAGIEVDPCLFESMDIPKNSYSFFARVCLERNSGRSS